MGKTDRPARLGLAASVRWDGLLLEVHHCRLCEQGQHGRCHEATEDPYVCYCGCNPLDNRPA